MGSFINVGKISALGFCLFTASCGSGSDLCGDLKPREFVINDYKLSAVRYPTPIDSQSSAQLTTPVTSAMELVWSTLSIELTAEYQIYQVHSQPVQVNLFAQASACSPAIPRASQKLTEISITSDNAFNDDLPAGSELAGIFGSFDFPQPVIASLNNANLAAPMRLKMNLLGAPQQARQNFRVEVTLDDSNIFVMETGDVYFVIEEDASAQ